jgi:hypothetical protein
MSDRRQPLCRRTCVCVRADAARRALRESRVVSSLSSVLIPLAALFEHLVVSPLHDWPNDSVDEALREN